MSPDRHWLCEPGEGPRGPFDGATIREMAARGEVGPRTMSCAEGGSAWVSVAPLLRPESPAAVPTVAAGAAPPPPPPPCVSADVPAAAGAAVSAEEATLGYLLPVAADPLAIVASYVALVGAFLWPIAPIGLVLAWMAWKRRLRFPAPANRMRCLIALVLGWIGTTLLVAVTLLLVLRGVYGW